MQAAIDALICHCAPTFCPENAAQFSQLPVSAMGSLLRKDNLDVTTELEVERMCCRVVLVFFAFSPKYTKLCL